MNRIAVHGLGYVGITAAVHFAKAGWRVVGYDPDRGVVEAVNGGRPRAGDMLRYIDGDAAQVVSSGALRATAARHDVADEPAHIVAVPTERGGEIEDGIVMETIEWIDLHGPLGVAVLVESTLNPGTLDRWLRQRDRPRRAVMPKIVGEDIFVAACPRRDWFADPERNLGNLMRIVGGVTPACTRRAAEILGEVSVRIEETDYRTAELVKAGENAMLHNSVMLGYQMALSFPDRNVAEALRLIGTHWRLQSVYLGFGTGGRCVPLGSKYLAAAAAVGRGWRLTIAEEAVWVDARFREHVAGAVHKMGARRALVLGVAYRPEFRDAGMSPGLGVARHLRELGVEVAVHDPMWSPKELERIADLRVESDGMPGRMATYDAILLATPHGMYRDWPTMARLWRPGHLVMDGQGTWAQHRAAFGAAGVRYVRVGEPGWLGEVEL